MSETNTNQQNGSYNQRGGSNYQSILSKNVPSQQSKNIYRNVNQISNEGNVYLSFGERVEQSPYLVSLEQKNNTKKNKKPKKKL